MFSPELSEVLRNSMGRICPTPYSASVTWYSTVPNLHQSHSAPGNRPSYALLISEWGNWGTRRWSWPSSHSKKAGDQIQTAPFHSLVLFTGAGTWKGDSSFLCGSLWMCSWVEGTSLFVGKKFFPQRWFLILRTEVFISLVYLIQQGLFRTWTHNDRSHTAGYRKGCIHGSFMRGIILHKKWGRSLFICYFFFFKLEIVLIHYYKTLCVCVSVCGDTLTSAVPMEARKGRQIPRS